MKLLLSLYACRPGEGSEPGVGWAWALGMARRHETVVVTRLASKERIERELALLNLPAGETPTFLFVEGPAWARRLVAKRRFPLQLYYLLWLFSARRAYDAQPWRADVIHHITFCSFLAPGVWWRRKEKVVLGPMGGMASCPWSLLRLFPPVGRLKEVLRRLIRACWWADPFFLLSRASADALFFTEAANSRRVGGVRAEREALMDVAVPPELEKIAPDSDRPRRREFVWAGRLEPRKGCEIALRAWSRAFGGNADAPVLKVVGTGPDREKLERLASSLGVAGSVLFLGGVPQATLWNELRRAMALVFTSVRDTCGTVNVEAMACGTPIVCFAHQGVGELTDETCAIRIEPGSWEDSINGFAVAMRRLDRDPGLVERMGSAGRTRALGRFTWNGKFDVADGIYRKLLSETAPHA